MEQLVCCLARSILIYIGTPMVAAGLWQRRDIDREETQLLRKVYNLPNNITSRAVNNILTQMRPAWSVVERLAAKTWRMFKKQNRVTEYYEKKQLDFAQQHELKKQERPEKIYIPRIMAELMLATTKNSTSITSGSVTGVRGTW